MSCVCDEDVVIIITIAIYKPTMKGLILQNYVLCTFWYDERKLYNVWKPYKILCKKNILFSDDDDF